MFSPFSATHLEKHGGADVAGFDVDAADRRRCGGAAESQDVDFATQVDGASGRIFDYLKNLSE